MNRLLLIVLTLLALNAHADGCLWYAERHDLKNQAGATVPIREARDIAATADCGVWALQDNRLSRFKADGSPDLDLRLPRNARYLEADPYDGSVWVAAEQLLWHLDAQGKLLQDLSPRGHGRWWGRERHGPHSGRYRDLTLGPDQSLWVLDGQRLTRYTKDGALIDSWDPRFRGDADDLLVDGLGSRYWLAGEKRLVAYDLSTRAPLIERRLDKDLEALALDPLTGTVWVLTDKSLQAYNPQGTPTQRILLRTLKINDPEDIAFDPLNHEVLVAHERGIARFSDTGTLKGTLPGRDIGLLAVPDFGLLPKLNLTSPPADALTNNPKPPFVLQYGAGCLAPDCGPGDAYFQALVLDAQLDTLTIGKSFVFDKTTRKAAYTPGSALQDGQHAFRAQVKDAFGHVSGTVTGQITVDTVPPKFLSITPADGSTFFEPNVTLQGSVDDLGSALTLEGLGSLLTQVLNNTLTFSRSLILAPGQNNLTVTAVDKAGNAASVRVTYTYVPVKVTIDAPAEGATVAGNQVLVTGTILGPANTGVTVNGTVAVQDAGKFYATVPLNPGANLLTVTAITQDGATVSKTINVTQSGDASFTVVANQLEGLAPVSVQFAVTPKSGVAIQNIDVDYNGDGAVDISTASTNTPLQYTYATPGTYRAKFTVTDDTGQATPQEVPIIVRDFQQMDTMLRGIYSGMLTKLKTGNIEGALAAVNGSAYEKYKAVFTALQPSLPTMVDQLGTIQSGTLGNEIAEYVLTRPQPDGSNRAFLIYFLRGEDGVWRIDSM